MEKKVCFKHSPYEGYSLKTIKKHGRIEIKVQKESKNNALKMVTEYNEQGDIKKQYFVPVYSANRERE